MLRRKVAPFLFLFALSCWTLSAHATRRYHLDLAGGPIRMQNTTPYYGGSTTTGTSFQLGLFYDLFDRSGWVRLFAGLDHRYFFTEANRKTVSTQILYPSVRLSIWLFYFTAGYSPWVWNATNKSWGIEGYSPKKKTSSMLVEAGVEIPIVPFFSLISSVSAQTITSSGVRSPNPAIDATVGFRFYFGAKKTKSSGGYGSFGGWRYPFGVERD